MTIYSFDYSTAYEPPAPVFEIGVSEKPPTKARGLP